MLYSSDFAELAKQRAIEHIEVIEKMLDDHVFMTSLATVAQAAFDVLGRGGKILLFGNGGSAADAQHIAAEFVGRFQRERKALPAVALTVNTSSLTAIANDYGFERVFARQIEALGQPGDVAVALSTSGKSASVINAVDAAKSGGLVTVGLTGATGGELSGRVRHCLQVPSEITPRIQEAHIWIGHVLCEWVEKSLFREHAGAPAG